MLCIYVSIAMCWPVCYMSRMFGLSLPVFYMLIKVTYAVLGECNIICQHMPQMCETYANKGIAVLYRLPILNSSTIRKMIAKYALLEEAEAETACQKWGGGLGIHQVGGYILNMVSIGY